MVKPVFFSVFTSRFAMPDTARFSVNFTSFGLSSMSTKAVPNRVFFASGHSSFSMASTIRPCLDRCSISSPRAALSPMPTAQCTGSSLERRSSFFISALLMPVFTTAAMLLPPKNNSILERIDSKAPTSR